VTWGKDVSLRKKIGPKKMCLQGGWRRGRGKDIPRGEDKPKEMGSGKG
jgi:hypothetical protein